MWKPALVSMLEPRRLSALQRARVLLVPWSFLAIYAAIYILFVLPRAAHGSVFGLIAAVVIAAVWLIFAVAAVTFSRDVLAGGWPE
jgi:hypothetical protein